MNSISYFSIHYKQKFTTSFQMIILKKASELKEWLHRQKGKDSTVGFVPTMGALHQGHLSLVEASMEHNDVTVVSIYINPKQFNEQEDFRKYPRQVNEDIDLLHKIAVDCLFLPDDEEIYPSGLDTTINFDPGPAADVMEGISRPGHFKGMAEVVHRLLTIVQPDRLYMGQKDFQQQAIVRKLITDFKLPVILEMCPTVREENGLAMSSRNARLSPDARQKAGVIFSSLVEAERRFEEGAPVEEIKANAINAIEAAGFIPEYFEIMDGITFEPVASHRDSQFVVASCAVNVEGIRLIDNAIWVRPE